jgi:hypothetical protein
MNAKGDAQLPATVKSRELLFIREWVACPSSYNPNFGDAYPFHSPVVDASAMIDGRFT